MAAVRPSAAAFEFSEFLKFGFRGRRRQALGKTSRCSLPLVPQGRPEAFPERPAVFHGKMRHREAQLRSRPAWPGAPRKDGGLRRPVARKAEGEAHLWAARAAVPQLF